MTPPSDPLLLASRLVDACPAPALLVEAGGRLRSANRAATSLLGLTNGGAEPSLRDLVGIGWREVELIARDGQSDLAAELPTARLLADRRGTRVRFEPIAVADGSLAGVVAFFEPSSDTVAPTRRSGRNDRGFDALFGDDPAVVATKEAGARFARTLLPILLLAETGTGKELLARAIHGASARRDRPFVAINCGALSPHLLESELFGYAPGAFTGASREGNDGKIGAARGGTLFLDEVGEMPGPLQALLLRVLEDGTYYRVGDNRPRQADVRLVCATCRDLPRLVADGAFRQDLYYRINGACLGLPPVRERQDVSALISHLLQGLAAEAGRATPPEMAPEAFESMVRFPWPGNVRQIKTALQHALILSDGDTIRPEHLPRELAESEPMPERRETVPPAAAPERSTAPPTPVRTLVEIERERLELAVATARGNLSRAADELGIARSTIYRRLRRHGLLA
ncbi:MAG: sigma 54-interacting transcriptional regulator [Holophagales bacterium]|nr:MAG: sigma 54-interacting transcriptional regulator [Holophagales bacterium]